MKCLIVSWSSATGCYYSTAFLCSCQSKMAAAQSCHGRNCCYGAFYWVSPLLRGTGLTDRSIVTSAIDNLWGIVKRKMRNKWPKNADELKATVKETWASTPPQQCHKLITSMPRRIEAVIKAKGAPTKYRVHINEYNFQKANNSQKMYKGFFLLVLWSILICWDVNWLVFVKCEPKEPKT